MATEDDELRARGVPPGFSSEAEYDAEYAAHGITGNETQDDLIQDLRRKLEVAEAERDRALADLGHADAERDRALMNAAVADRLPPVVPHPMQPIILSCRPVDGLAGTIRFQRNAIVEWLLGEASAGRRVDMNTIALQGFDDEDARQFAQLIGYSVSGYGDLSYAQCDMASVERADGIAEEVARHGRPTCATAPPDRILDLARRLVAPGPKASHVSASECHEISEFILSLAGESS